MNVHITSWQTLDLPVKLKGCTSSLIKQIFSSCGQFLKSLKCSQKTDFLGCSFERKLFQRGVCGGGGGVFYT